MRSKSVKCLIPTLLCALVATHGSAVQAQALDAQESSAKFLLLPSLDLRRNVDSLESSRTLRGNGEKDKLLVNSRLRGLVGNELLIAGKGDDRSTFDTQLDPQYEVLAKEVGFYFDVPNRSLINRLIDVQGYAIAQVFDDPSTGFRAIGLSSKDGSKPPVLSFPGGDGGDTRTVGSSQFSANKQAIQDWLVSVTNDRQINPKGFKPDITGVSLGGSLIQQTASEFPKSIGSVVSFQSTGIAQETAEKFIKHGGDPHQVRHYIVDGDFRSLIGEAFIPGRVVVSTFEVSEADRANYFGRKHLSGILADFQSFLPLIPENAAPLIIQALILAGKPANQTLSEISVDELNQPDFTFQGKDWQVGLEIVRANNPNFVVDRQHVEELRRSGRAAFNKTFPVQNVL
jgi:serralysin